MMQAIIPFMSRPAPAATRAPAPQPAVRLVISAGGRRLCARLRHAAARPPAPSEGPDCALSEMLGLPH